MAVICKTEISTRDVTYDAARRRLIAEASELPAPGRVFDDACDVGYMVRSHHTGRVILFSELEVRRDADGDVQVWIYRAVARNVDLELHVLND